MDHPPVAFRPQPPQQLPYPTIRQPQLRRRLLLAQLPLLHFVQNLQTIPFSLAHD